jgi:predicted MFS family arabinose efflux permease
MAVLMAGLSARGWSGINMVFVAEMAGRPTAATAAGMNLTANYLGVMVGPPAFRLLADLTGSYTSPFQAAAVISVLALFLISLVVPHRVEQP